MGTQDGVEGGCTVDGVSGLLEDCGGHIFIDS